MLELSNFLLPSCWASAPLGSFVPDNRIESEVVLATKKYMLESEKRLYCKTSKRRARVFTFYVNTYRVLNLKIFSSVSTVPARETTAGAVSPAPKEDTFPGTHL